MADGPWLERPRLLALHVGEIASFVVWGPLMIGGGYYVITGHWSGEVLLASVPYGLGVMSILLGKHIDQRPFDIGAGQHTLPVLMGAVLFALSGVSRDRATMTAADAPNARGAADLIAGLLDHRLDLALIVAPDTGVDPELTAAPLLRENLVVASAVAGPPPIEDGSMARFRGERTSLGASGARGGNFSVTSRARGVASEGL